MGILCGITWPWVLTVSIILCWNDLFKADGILSDAMHIIIYLFIYSVRPEDQAYLCAFLSFIPHPPPRVRTVKLKERLSLLRANCQHAWSSLNVKSKSKNLSSSDCSSSSVRIRLAEMLSKTCLFMLFSVCSSTSLEQAYYTTGWSPTRAYIVMNPCCIFKPLDISPS